MAYDKVIDSAILDANLTSVADAIRAKGGTNEPLSFPDGFVNAVEGIQAGGEKDTLDAFLRNELTEYESDKVEHIFSYGMAYNTKLTKVNFPNLTDMGTYAFCGCSALKDVSIPKLNTAASAVFHDCTSLEEVQFPKLSMPGNFMFRGCKALRICDFVIANSIANQMFLNASSLKTVILRNSRVASLFSVDCFKNTPFESGGTGGTVYVPSALIESYQTATNWSTLYAAGTCNFVAIEGSEYE